MDAFELSDLLSKQRESHKLYLEFLRPQNASMSLGLYVLPTGGVDLQQPHTEDEAYYVVRGRGMIRVGDEDRAVQPGSTVFVAAGVEHRFYSITEELILLVFFSPAEYSH